MRYNPRKHHRRSIRLKAYDYSQAGWYFITICTHNQERLFGEIADGEMLLFEAGESAKKYWLEIPNHFPNVDLDEFIIMPNHVHGIISIINDAGANMVGAKNVSPLQNETVNKFHSPSKTIGSIIRGFKIGVTKWIRNNTGIYNVWQRNYYDHIIRDEMELNRVRRYIIENPLKWPDDKYFLKGQSNI